MNTILNLHGLSSHLSVKGRDTIYNYSYITFIANETDIFNFHVALREVFKD